MKETKKIFNILVLNPAASSAYVAAAVLAVAVSSAAAAAAAAAAAPLIVAYVLVAASDLPNNIIDVKKQKNKKIASRKTNLSCTNLRE